VESQRKFLSISVGVEEEAVHSSNHSGKMI
jgi:hypothetical protein